MAAEWNDRIPTPFRDGTTSPHYYPYMAWFLGRVEHAAVDSDVLHGPATLPVALEAAISPGRYPTLAVPFAPRKPTPEFHF